MDETPLPPAGIELDARLWGKEKGLLRPYPLICHLLDTAAIAGRLWDVMLGARSRGLIAERVGLGEDASRRLVCCWAGLHDLGKITPAGHLRLVQLRHHERQGRALMATPIRTISGTHGDPLAEAIELTRRLELPHLRRALSDLIPTAKAQRWDPAEVVRVLLAEEAAGRDAANRLVPGVAAAECFEGGCGVVAGGGVDVDKVADGSAVRQSSHLGADDVVESEDGAVLGSRGWPPEGFFSGENAAL